MYTDGVFHIKSLSELENLMKTFESEGIEVSLFEFYGHGDNDGIYFSEVLDNQGIIIGYSGIVTNNSKNLRVCRTFGSG